jgi:hypothetical protein
MARLATWAKATGGAALGALTHSVPLLILVTTGLIVLSLVALVWILADDRRAERLNLLLRGGKLPRRTGAELAPDQETVEADAGPAVRPEPRPPLSPQTMDYAAILRQAGRPDLAELLERAPQAGGNAEDELGSTTRPRRT